MSKDIIKLTQKAAEARVTRDTGYTKDEGMFHHLVDREIGSSIESLPKGERVPPGYERSEK